MLRSSGLARASVTTCFGVSSTGGAPAWRTDARKINSRTPYCARGSQPTGPFPGMGKKSGRCRGLRSRWLDAYPEGMVIHRLHVQEQASRFQAVAVAVIGRGAEEVPQAPGLAAEVREGEREVALALVLGVVHRDHHPLSARALPGGRDEAVVGPVAVPGGPALDQLPAAVPHGGRFQD